jgi:hypothetical protein
MQLFSPANEKVPFSGIVLCSRTLVNRRFFSQVGQEGGVSATFSSKFNDSILGPLNLHKQFIGDCTQNQESRRFDWYQFQPPPPLSGCCTCSMYLYKKVLFCECKCTRRNFKQFREKKRSSCRSNWLGVFPLQVPQFSPSLFQPFFSLFTDFTQ